MDQTGTLTTGARRFHTRRRRFLLVATAALAAVGVAMGISFTADTGTATVGVNAGSSSSLVFPVTAGAAHLPADDPNGDKVVWGAESTVGSPSPASALAYGTTAYSDHTTGPATQNTVTVKAPNWSPVAGAAGAVTTAGDLFVIDGRTDSAGGAGHITVTVYVTNLANLQSAYSSFAWPVALYYQDGTVVSTTATVSGGFGTPGWKDASHTNDANIGTSGFDAQNYFLTNTGGFVSYYLPTGANRFYEIALDSTNVAPNNVTGAPARGGSFYTVNTTTGSNLQPQFFVTAQAT